MAFVDFSDIDSDEGFVRILQFGRHYDGGAVCGWRSDFPDRLAKNDQLAN